MKFKTTPEIVMGEKVPTEDLVHHVAHLLNRFADDTHSGLTDPKFVHYVHPKTGVMVKKEWSDNPNLVVFMFFITGRKGTPGEVNQLMSVEFDMKHFHYNPMGYVANMIRDTAKRITAVAIASMDRTDTMEANRASNGNLY